MLFTETVSNYWDVIIGYNNDLMMYDDFFLNNNVVTLCCSL